MMKQIITTVFVFLFLIAGTAIAEKKPFVVFETDSLSIKLSKDGTGIIKDIGCLNCDFTYVYITKNSKATVNGQEVNILDARLRAGKGAMVSFDPNTREVQFIRWAK